MAAIKTIKCIFIISSVLSLFATVKCSKFRLPNNTAPKLYRLDFEPHIDDADFTFNGNSSILFEVFRPTDTLTIHASNLIHIETDYTKILCHNGTIRRPVSQVQDVSTEFLHVKFDYTLPVGEYTIEFKWKGYDALDDPNQKGFIRQMVEVNGVSENVISTVFEPRGARQAFPCWDEPGFKAEISLSIKHSTHYTAISNMPVEENIIVDNETVWTVFQKSPPMSTYHLAMFVGIFEGMTNEFKNMTYWTQPDKLEHFKFTAEISPLIISALENYTGITFSLPKLDSVHVPAYPAEANEHWGAVTYSNSYLRKFGTHDTTQDFKIAMTIAHEISHQWFGNLVTHKFWDDIWLTESFATYFSYKMLDDISHRWRAKDRFATLVINEASFVSEESNRFKHPVTFIPDKLTGPDEKFENIVYEKGAGILQMLEHIVSEDVFRNGVRNYLDKSQFGSVTTEDLLVSLQAAYEESQSSFHLNIKEMMNSWLTQKGHPLLNVTRNYETGVVTITQCDAVYGDSSNRWKIPITFATASQPDFEKTEITHWMEPTTDTLEIHGVDKDDWIILNIQSKDFYQVVYDSENWKRLTSYLNSDNYSKIHMLNRAQLLYDGYAQPRDNNLLFSKMMDVLSYLSREIDLIPWMHAIKGLSSLIRDHINCPMYESIRRFALHLLQNVTDYVGFESREDDDDLTRSFRFELLDLACQCGHKKCRQVAHERLIKFLHGEIEAPTDPNEEHWMFCSGLYSANESIWNSLLNDFSDRHLVYLGCTKNKTLIEKYLKYALDNPSRKVFKKTVFSLLHGPEENYDYFADFFVGHIAQISQYFNKGNCTNTETIIERVVERMIDSARTRAHEEKLMKLFNARAVEFRNVERHIRHLRGYVDFFVESNKRFQAAIKDKPYYKYFLEENNDV